ncbi:hypothetical protein [Verminephrobacter eiseniae]|uniref:hypothetical protein n=1 Tax=Verminephrobacter eiseniae TaxID=364317 RepID=UPI002237829D|nr:hypothetical protein [Verminephrobacter eiseniae]
MKQISIAMAACAVLLAGCGSEPGEADVKAALLKQIEAAVSRQAAKGQQAELDALKGHRLQEGRQQRLCVRLDRPLGWRQRQAREGRCWLGAGQPEREVSARGSGRA